MTYKQDKKLHESKKKGYRTAGVFENRLIKVVPVTDGCEGL
jgi:hypothetical protein